jgi:hypothetical protein
VLSIIGLTSSSGPLLIPLFVKQIKSSRNMQLIQPKVKELQKKYGHDREKLAQETMKLYKESGHQPVRLVPADPAADADLPGAVPLLDHAAKRHRPRRAPDRRSGESSSATPSSSGDPSRHLPQPTATSRVQIMAAIAGGRDDRSRRSRPSAS